MQFDISTITAIRDSKILENLNGWQAANVLGISLTYLYILERAGIVNANADSGARSKRYDYDHLKSIKLPRKHKAQNP